MITSVDKAALNPNPNPGPKPKGMNDDDPDGRSDDKAALIEFLGLLEQIVCLTESEEADSKTAAGGGCLGLNAKPARDA